jgi:hypothetical protein
MKAITVAAAILGLVSKVERAAVVLGNGDFALIINKE